VSWRRVLIVEDDEKLASLLGHHLEARLPDLVTEPRPGEHDTDYEVAEPRLGQLAHLAHTIRYAKHLGDHDHVQGEPSGPAIPAIRAFPASEKAQRELVRLARDFDPGIGPESDEGREGWQQLYEYVSASASGEFDILFTDLAIGPEEGPRIESVGGFKASPAHPWAELEAFNSPEDPRITLRDLTGFKLLRAFKHRCPVIVSSTCRNPLIIQHCLVNGAVAYIEKPLSFLSKNTLSEVVEDVDPFSPGSDESQSMEEFFLGLDTNAKAGVDPLSVVVNLYVTRCAMEILRAVDLAVHRDDSTDADDD